MTPKNNKNNKSFMFLNNKINKIVNKNEAITIPELIVYKETNPNIKIYNLLLKIEYAITKETIGAKADGSERNTTGLIKLYPVSARKFIPKILITNASNK